MILLDTNVLLNISANKYSPSLTRFLTSGKEPVFVSIVSYWEIAIKCKIGKLSIDRPISQFIAYQENINKFQTLQISAAHLHVYEVMDFDATHKDPYDRLILAQAEWEGLRIIAEDRRIIDYKRKS